MLHDAGIASPLYRLQNLLGFPATHSETAGSGQYGSYQGQEGDGGNPEGEGKFLELVHHPLCVVLETLNNFWAGRLEPIYNCGSEVC